MRFAIPLFPAAYSEIAPLMMALGVVGSSPEPRSPTLSPTFKRMVAYTSISHLGFVLLGIFAGNALALQGALLGIICHGLATGALFVIAGIIQERTGSGPVQTRWAVGRPRHGSGGAP